MSIEINQEYTLLNPSQEVLHPSEQLEVSQQRLRMPYKNKTLILAVPLRIRGGDSTLNDTPTNFSVEPAIIEQVLNTTSDKITALGENSNSNALTQELFKYPLKCLDFDTKTPPTFKVVYDCFKKFVGNDQQAIYNANTYLEGYRTYHRQRDIFCPGLNPCSELIELGLANAKITLMTSLKADYDRIFSSQFLLHKLDNIARGKENQFLELNTTLTRALSFIKITQRSCDEASKFSKEAKSASYQTLALHKKNLIVWIFSGSIACFIFQQIVELIKVRFYHKPVVAVSNPNLLTNKEKILIGTAFVFGILANNKIPSKPEAVTQLAELRAELENLKGENKKLTSKVPFSENNFPAFLRHLVYFKFLCNTLFK